MKVAFQKHQPGMFDGLIRWWTHSPYSHCEILFDDGQMFSAQVGQGTRFWTPGHLDPNAWDLLLVPMTLEEEILLKSFCKTEAGCGYDWWGLIASQIFRLQREHPHKWFCSEICACAVQKLGRAMGSKPCTFSPGKLHKRLRESGAVICAQY
jgi:hypothetical protein